MRRTKMSILPSVDVMEPRVLLSTAAPLLSKHALSAVVRDVKAIMSTLAKTEDTGQASAQLTGLSTRIPSGPEGLALSWQSDLGLYRPQSARSIVTTERRILGDLYRYVQGGVDGSNPPATGSGSTTTPTSTTSPTSHAPHNLADLHDSRPGRRGDGRSGAHAKSRQRED